MAREEWDALGPHEPDEETGLRRRSIETHPQFHLKLLLDRMGVGRGEVERWRWGGGRDAPAVRSRAIAHAMKPAAFTDLWQGLRPAERRLTGVRAIELADPAEEAQAIAIALREALETPGRTAALVTPDRSLARRVSTHLRRWGIEADDSAGRPLSQLAPGTLLLALATAAAEQFAPVPLLALLKHPLVMRGEGRLDWLDGARALDLALRGPRPPAGLDGITAYLSDRSGRDRERRERAAAWWRELAPLLRPLETGFRVAQGRLPALLGLLRESASELSGEQAWAGPAGRAAAELFDGRAGVGQRPGPAFPRPASGPARAAARRGGRSAAFRPASADLHLGPDRGQAPARRSRHPGRAQRGRLAAIADSGSLAGAAPPRRARLPGLERRIGLAAHDFASALGGREVLVTRARRDARAPAIASRFWLRLEAMTGGITRAPAHRNWARAIDRPRAFTPAARPAPAPRAGAPAQADRRHRGRPAEGRPVRLLRPQDARLSRLSIRSTPIRAPPGAEARSTRCSKPG